MAATLLGSWISEAANNATSGHAIGSHTAETGSNRVLVCVFGNEQGGVANADHHVSSATYGGRSMTLAGIASTQIGTTNSHASIWYLLEADIALASDNVIDSTWVIDSPPRSEILGGAIMAHAFFGGVDQTSPLVDSDATSSTSTNPLSLTLTTLADGLAVAAAAAGNASTYTWSGITEVTDQNSPGTGFTLSVATAATTGSDVSPSASFDGTLNRHLLIAATFKAASGDKTVNATGNAGTGSVGTTALAITTNPAVTGNAATGSVGTTTPKIDKGVTGQAATGSVGTVSVTLSSNANVTGNAATGSTGTPAPNVLVFPAGNQATGAVGAVTVSAGGSISVNATGNAATGSVGSPAVTLTGAVAVTGNAAAGQVGAVVVAFPVAQSADTPTPGREPRGSYDYLDTGVSRAVKKSASDAIRRVKRLPPERARKMAEEAYETVAASSVAATSSELAASLAPFAGKFAAGLIPPAYAVRFDELIANADALKALYTAYYETLENEEIEILLLAS